jgi:hypothetical protein
MYTSNTINSQAILQLLLQVYRKQRSGIITPAQAQQEAGLLHGLLKALETTELQARIEALEAKLHI